jgi:hypothetical protein
MIWQVRCGVTRADHFAATHGFAPADANLDSNPPWARVYVGTGNARRIGPPNETEGD